MPSPDAAAEGQHRRRERGQAERLSDEEAGNRGCRMRSVRRRTTAAASDGWPRESCHSCWHAAPAAALHCTALHCTVRWLWSSVARRASGQQRRRQQQQQKASGSSGGVSRRVRTHTIALLPSVCVQGEDGGEGRATGKLARAAAVAAAAAAAARLTRPLPSAADSLTPAALRAHSHATSGLAACRGGEGRGQRRAAATGSKRAAAAAAIAAAPAAAPLARCIGWQPAHQRSRARSVWSEQRRRGFDHGREQQHCQQRVSGSRQSELECSSTDVQQAKGRTHQPDAAQRQYSASARHKQREQQNGTDQHAHCRRIDDCTHPPRAISHFIDFAV